MLDCDTHEDIQMDDWVEVVPPMTREEAERAFRTWRDSNPAVSSSLGDQDVRIDIVRVLGGGTRFRYMVRLPVA